MVWSLKSRYFLSSRSKIKRFINFSLSSSFSFFCLALHLLSEAQADDLVKGSRHTSARAAALGDSPRSFSDDVAAGLFYNPADLGRVRFTNIEPINFSGNINSNAISMSGANLFKIFSLESYAATLQNNSGKMSNVGGAILPNFGFPGFSFGILGQTQLGARDNGDGNLTVRSQYQLIPTVGTGARLLNGMLRVGYSLQWVNQAVGNNTVNSSGTLGYNQGITQGSGFSHNFGLTFLLPLRGLPTFDFVVRDAFNTHYRSASILHFTPNPSGTPEVDPMSFDFGFSVHPRLGNGSTLHFTITDRDVTNRSDDSLLGRLAIGAEVEFRRIFFLRGGWGSGYPSAGIGFRQVDADMSLAWFSQEIGASYHDTRDTRLMLQYQMRLL